MGHNGSKGLGRRQDRDNFGFKNMYISNKFKTTGHLDLWGSAWNAPQCALLWDILAGDKFRAADAECRKWMKDIWWPTTDIVLIPIFSVQLASRVEGNDTTSELPTMERMGGVLRDQEHWGLVTIDLRSVGHVAVT